MLVMLRACCRRNHFSTMECLNGVASRIFTNLPLLIPHHSTLVSCLPCPVCGLTSITCGASAVTSAMVAILQLWNLKSLAAQSHKSHLSTPSATLSSLKTVNYSFRLSLFISNSPNPPCVHGCTTTLLISSPATLKLSPPISLTLVQSHPTSGNCVNLSPSF